MSLPLLAGQPDVKSIRSAIDEAIEAGGAAKARSLLRQLWSLQRGAGVARFVASRYERIAKDLNFVEHRVAILRSFTVEPVVPLLEAAGYEYGISLGVQVGAFNGYMQEVLDTNSDLYSFQPHSIFVAIQTRDIAPELWSRAATTPAEQLEAARDRIVSTFHTLLTALRQSTQANVILHSLETPAAPATGILDAQSPNGQAETIASVNRRLRAMLAEFRGVYLLDYDGLVARHGKNAWHDERRWQSVRLPITSDHLMDMADEWIRYLTPLSGKVSKALVVDLDNTLWGGVVGEDGPTGIQLGPEHPGVAYQNFQQAVLDLYERGIIIAVASKNNEADAMEVIENHPGMILRPDHLAALRINWNDKAQSLREIAEELNIGIDALAFFDDNPVEREWVKSQLPEVTVIEVPEDAMEYVQALRSPVFERLTLSDEDRERGRYYAQDRQRNSFAQSISSVEDFYRSLEMEIEVAECDTESLPRVAQLTQKTNQFNLTTRRYTEQQVEAMMADPAWDILTIRVKDRFGDNGLVGVVMTREEGDASEIDTFLMSCRVMGRTVETSILSAVAEAARQRGKSRLIGWYLPTPKNVVVKDIYSSHGLVCTTTSDKGTLWELDIVAQDIVSPEWNRLLVLMPQLSASTI